MQGCLGAARADRAASQCARQRVSDASRFGTLWRQSASSPVRRVAPLSLASASSKNAQISEFLQTRCASTGHRNRRLQACVPPGRTAAAPGTAHAAEPKFNLETAVMLAAASFEAYLEPVTATGLTDVAVNGAETHYVDRNLVQDVYAGVLKVTARSGRNLRAADFTGSSDPYIVFSCGQSSATTSWKAQTLEPVWNESFNLWVLKGPAADKLKVDVRDKDFLDSDDDLGTAFVALSDLQPERETEVAVKLRGPYGDGGVVKLALTYIPFVADSACTEQVLDAVEKEGLEARLTAGAPDLAAMVLGGVAEEGVPPPQAAAPSEVVAMQACWAALAEVYQDSVLASAQRVAYVDNPRTDTQLWISRSVATKQVVVAFRGTEQVKWKDLVTDLNLELADLNYENVQTEQSMLQKIFRPAATPTVHKGFLAAWNSVKARTVSLVDLCTGGDPSWRVYVTGHSLGGALATLAAYTLASRRKVRYDKLTMYNYGSPRVGNRVFADGYAEVVRDSWRVHNHADVVAAVPRLMGYCHVPNGVQIDAEGKLRMLDAQGVDVWGEGKSTLELFEEWSERWVDEREVKDALGKVLEHEMRLLEALKDGDALAQHMEDFYLESLCKIISARCDDAEIAAVIDGVRAKLAEWRARTANPPTGDSPPVAS